MDIKSPISNPKSDMIFEQNRQNHLNSHLESSKLAIEILTCLLFFIVTVALGSLGYVVIEGWSTFDAFYMTIITVTTVGFAEVLPLSFEGRVFTTLLIILGVAQVAYFFSFIGRTIVHGEIGQIGFWKKMSKNITKLNEHIIICGFGRLSQVLAQSLSSANMDFVVIENNPNSVKKCIANDYLVVEGNAVDEDSLKSAGIGRSSVVLALLPSDADNVYVTLSSKDINPDLKVYARSENPNSPGKLKSAGADGVLAPYEISAMTLCDILIGGNDSNLNKAKTNFIVKETFVSNQSPLLGKTTKELSSELGLIAGIKKEDGRVISLDQCTDKICSGDTILSVAKS